jgi:hypothetical protein
MPNGGAVDKSIDGVDLGLDAFHDGFDACLRREVPVNSDSC